MKYSNRTPWQRFISSPISLVVLILVVFVLARATSNIYDKAKTSEQRLGQAEASLGKLTEHQTEISRRVERLSTDQGIEAEMRTKYHAVKDGESVAVIVDDSSSSKKKASSTEEIATSSSWWGRVLRSVGF